MLLPLLEEADFVPIDAQPRILQVKLSIKKNNLNNISFIFLNRKQLYKNNFDDILNVSYSFVNLYILTNIRL